MGNWQNAKSEAVKNLIQKNAKRGLPLESKKTPASRSSSRAENTLLLAVEKGKNCKNDRFTTTGTLQRVLGRPFRRWSLSMLENMNILYRPVIFDSLGGCIFEIWVRSSTLERWSGK